ncbi:hypothetical protein C8R43DRAFT_1101348, partial [Mycena crocata]
MPHPTAGDVRLANLEAVLFPVVPLLNEFHDAFGTPFVPAIASTILASITALQLMENIHGVVLAIVNLHLKSEIGGTVPPATLHDIAKFTDTLHKIHLFIEGQQDGNTFKRFLRQAEMKTLLRDCNTGLEQALEAFKIGAGAVLVDLAEIQQTTERMHKEILELISTLSDGTTSDRRSWVQAEWEKTSLARAALHHPEVIAKYDRRFFVAGDSATDNIELAALIASHLGLKPGKNVIKPVIRFLSSGPSSLLILDNLETSWEPTESRTGIEEFLSLITDIPNLALILLSLELQLDNPDVAETIPSILSFHAFSRLTGISESGCAVLMDRISALLPQLGDYTLMAHFTIEIFRGQNTYPIVDPELLIDRTIKHFKNLTDPALESNFYLAVGLYQWICNRDKKDAVNFADKALGLAKSCGDTNLQSRILIFLSEVLWFSGDYHVGRLRAGEAQQFAQMGGN